MIAWAAGRRAGTTGGAAMSVMGSGCEEVELMRGLHGLAYSSGMARLDED